MGAPDWLTAQPVAHRGLHDISRGIVENMPAAAEAAIAGGFAIECDIQLTADGQIVVFHDDSLERLTNLVGDVAAKTFAELRAARFLAGTATIPTLEELLDLVDGKVPLIVEFKSRFTGDRRLEKAAANVLLGYEGPLAVMSFDPASTIALRRLAPGIPRGLLADRFEASGWPEIPSHVRRLAYRWMLAAPFIWPAFVAYDVNALPASPPLALRHFFRLPLLTWTVRTPEQRAIAKEWADQVIFEGFDPAAG